jgi:glycine dehydrogenase
MAGMQVVVIECDENGNVSIEDIKSKIAEHGSALAALMITYPSTHGVFETAVSEICALIHDAGGQVYVDGANLNALVGVAQPENSAQMFLTLIFTRLLPFLTVEEGLESVR